MAEYIEREAFREFWNKEFRHLYPNDTYLVALANFPAADVVEVRHGEWKDGGEGDWRCSNCNEYFTIDIDMHPIDDCEMNYCSNCGAKMDGKDTGEH